MKYIIVLFITILAALMINASPLPDAEPEAHDNPYGSTSYDEKPKPTHKTSYNSGYEKPSTGYEKPSTGYEKPSTGYEKKSTGYEKPSSDYEKPNPYS